MNFVLPWQAPNEHIRMKEVRSQAVQVLIEPLSNALLIACQGEIPENMHTEALRAVKKGISSIIKKLTAAPSTQGYCFFWGQWQFMLPGYWEPAVAEHELPLPTHQLRAYRWVAALIALEVRNELEGVHARHIPDSCMPALNRGLRNAAYQTLLDHPTLAWALSFTLRIMIDLSAQGKPFRIPKCIG